MCRWLALACCLTLSLRAHPGVGIVRDHSGNVFYTDLSQVWRLSPDGAKRIFVPAVHTHELSIDAEDNLYGEHLWYNGDAAKTWGHFVWRAAPDGHLDKIIPNTPGFLTNYGFARDAANNLYFADSSSKENGPAIKRRAPDGQITTIVQNKSFHDIRWLTCSPNGTVYLIDRADLIRVSTNGSIKVLARQLSESNAADQRHMVMGLCADDAGNVHVAVYHRRAVKKISPDGKVTVAAKSEFPWAPSGVLATATGELWVLEATEGNQVRARHVGHGS